MSSATYASTTQTNPMNEDAKMACTGTPRELTRSQLRGASPRPAKTNSMREAVYIAELRQDSTAVSTTIRMMLSACGIPMVLNAVTKGEVPKVGLSHGTITAMRKMEPTKKSPIR
ncbi:Uncharacterised protein [Mycobacteroides abscessus subsp. massiliense]|nr:Uncharacterised protein [Mycobacteroides abscessus subsp. massiliense]